MFLGTNKIKNIIKKEYYFIIILFILSFIINQNLNKETKLSLLLCVIVLCIYNPILLVPFITFWLSFFIGYKYFTIENFETSKSSTNDKCLEVISITEDLINFKNSENFKNIRQIIYNFDNYTSDIDFGDYIDNVKFIKYFFNIFFFDEDDDSTWDFIKNIGDNIPYSNFESQLNMTDYESIIQSNIQSNSPSPSYDNDIKGLDTISKLLFKNYVGDELIYKCLGIHFHLNINFKEKSSQMIRKIGFKKLFDNNELKYQDLSDIVNNRVNNDNLSKEDCEYKKSVHLMNKIKKNLNELVIIQYKMSIDDADIDNDYFKDREIIIDPYLIFNENYSPKHIYYKKINFILNPKGPEESDEINNKFIFLPTHQQIEGVIKETFDMDSSNEEFINEYIKLFSEVIMPYLDSDSDIFKKQFNYLSLIYIFNDDNFIDFINSKIPLIKQLYTTKSPLMEKMKDNLEDINTIDIFINNIFYYCKNVISELKVEKIFKSEIFQIELFSEYKLDKNLDSLQIKNKVDLFKKELDKDFKEEKFSPEVSDIKKYNSKKFYPLIDNISDSIFNIINDFKELFYGKYNNSPSGSDDNYSKFYQIFHNVIEILSKNGRAIHSGILMVIIALFIYFLDDNKSNYIQKPNFSLFDLLKTN